MTDSRILVGDSLVVLPTLSERRFHSCVTDPPYEIGFMGSAWDRRGVSFDPDTWRAVLRVMRPGAYLAAFGGTRTWHRIACAIEDAGFVIVDNLAWIHSQGMPKGSDAGKAFDREAGAEREDLGQKARIDGNKNHFDQRMCNGMGYRNAPPEKSRRDSVPATDLARLWDEWRTGLRPAFEPIILAHRPREGTVCGNLRTWGCGALNTGACRVECEGGSPSAARREAARKSGSWKNEHRPTTFNPIVSSYLDPRPGETRGRLPQNVLLECDCDGPTPPHHEECPCGMLDAMSGDITGGHGGWGGVPGFSGGWRGISKRVAKKDRPGGASRMYFQAKASQAERRTGMTQGARNTHLTVKPEELMRWLVKLTTPPDGEVLDPFAGSGTTGLACRNLGMSFLGIERDPEFARIARERVDGELFAKEDPL